MPITEISKYTTLVLAIFMVLGGIMGYVKAKSKASLISGCLSGTALGLVFAYATTGGKPEIPALVITGLLDVVFGIRLAKTKKFMPAGMLLILCIISQVIFVQALMAPQ